MLQFSNIHQANAALDRLAHGQRVAVLGRIARVDKSLGALRFKCAQEVAKASPDRKFVRGKQGNHTTMVATGG